MNNREKVKIKTLYSYIRKKAIESHPFDDESLLNTKPYLELEYRFFPIKIFKDYNDLLDSLQMLDNMGLIDFIEAAEIKYPPNEVRPFGEVEPFFRIRFLKEADISKVLNTQNENEEKQRIFIYRDSKTGDFFCKSKIIEFENKKTIYYLIFEFMHNNSDHDGFCSYKQIDGHLIKNGWDALEPTEARVRIKNGIESLKRFAKNLPKKAPDGKLVITKIRGKGVILHNPAI